MIANLFATLPLYARAPARRVGDRSDRFRVLLAISADGTTLTVAALLGLVIVLYLFASTMGGRWAVLPALPFLLYAIEPFSGEGPGSPACCCS